jgi:hypothetical protein
MTMRFSQANNHLTTTTIADPLSVTAAAAQPVPGDLEYSKLYKTPPATAAAVCVASNACLGLGLLCIFVVWLYFMARSLHLDLTSSLQLVAESTAGPLLDVEALPAYALDRASYCDLLPGQRLLQRQSVLPDYYLRDDVLRSEYPKLFALHDLLAQWPARDVSRGRWRLSVAHPLFGADNELRLRRSSASSTSTSNNAANPSSSGIIPNGLYRLDFQNESQRSLAFHLRDLEVPYVLFNVPDLDHAAETAFSAESLQHQFGALPRVVERSRDSEFMYYTAKDATALLVSRRFPDWRPPQEDTLLTFRGFLQEAMRAEQDNHDRLAEAQAEQVLLTAASAESAAGMAGYSGSGARKSLSSKVEVVGNQSLHYLIVAAAEGGRTDWIKRALPFFAPTESLFMREPEQYRGM